MVTAAQRGERGFAEAFLSRMTLGLWNNESPSWKSDAAAGRHKDRLTPPSLLGVFRLKGISLPDSHLEEELGDDTRRMTGAI
ncbi:hypothetical protein EYF80_036054 [Liparis tanakae]|uniref:Uncharacterized protein n=1 Tax=Liparis tanakae TaxID=230148 RepID=A0A4Z2GKD4_9TELE|nr:hypothetical protein EYF80_036054 [Liparis tanakae]